MPHDPNDPWADNPDPESGHDSDAPAPRDAITRDGVRDDWDQPPQDNVDPATRIAIDAERQTLGAMLATGSLTTIGDIMDTVAAPDYYLPDHEAVHDVIAQMYVEQQPIDLVTVAREVVRRGIKTGALGRNPAVFLHDLSNGCLIPTLGPHHALTVRDQSVRRRVAAALTALRQRTESGEDDTADTLVAAVQDTALALTGSGRDDDTILASDAFMSTLEGVEARGNGEVAPTIPTGIADLDDVLNGGWRTGQFVIVAARPGTGKTVACLDFARAAAIHHRVGTLVASLEMTADELAERLIAAEAKVDFGRIRSGHLTDDDWDRVARIQQRVVDADLHIADAPVQTLPGIFAAVRRKRLQGHDIRVLVLDHLGLLSSVPGHKPESRQLEVTEWSRQLKIAAKQMDLVIILASQLNRGPTSRSDKRPVLSDLRESGALEQDADIVVMIHREDMHDPDSTRPGEADLILTKHRGGSLRDVAVAFQGHYQRFVTMAH